MKIVGILLAAGRGMRFDPSGRQDKLMQTLPSGEQVAEAAARHLLQVFPTVQAVVRPGADELGQVLAGLGCHVELCRHASAGMATSLIAGLKKTLDADGWVIALADMPHVQPATITALAAALRAGADIVQPVCHGHPGNPVGFSRQHLAQLLGLEGDRGARALLQQHPVTQVTVDDEGILRDIDTMADLHE